MSYIPNANRQTITLDDLTMNPSVNNQDVYAQTGHAYRRVWVNKVTSSIDANIQPGNIRSGVTILEVTGTY